jgi:hypothetical protein
MIAMAHSLDISYRKGKPMAAYLALAEGPAPERLRSEERGTGLVVDFGPDGHAVGVEITAPSAFTLAALNAVLASLGQPPATEQEISPLLRARAA